MQAFAPTVSAETKGRSVLLWTATTEVLAELERKPNSPVLR